MSLLLAAKVAGRAMNELIVRFSRAGAPADLIDALKRTRNGLRAAADEEERALADLASAFNGEPQDSGRMPVADAALGEGDREA